jgi:NADPH:quinone reductase-like Zn-dependent oxidoreductase
MSDGARPAAGRFFPAGVLIGLGALVAGGPATAAESVPAVGRKVVLDKAGERLQWKIVEATVPAPGPRQVLVRVRAVALNRGDVEMLDPKFGAPVGRVVASDAAGEIVGVGSGVKDFRVGDRVTSLYFRNWTDGPPSDEKLAATHGASVDGVLADYLALDDTAVASMPQGLSFEEASTLPTAGLTAWMAVNGHRALRPGDVVVVQGTGGVSTFALQFAAALGARVITTSSSDAKLERAKALGARDGINYRTTPAWSARVLELTEGRGADVVVDVGGTRSLPESAKSLAHLGQLSVVGGLTGYDGQVPAINLLLKTARAQGIYVGSRADYLRMGEFIAERKLRPAIDRVYPLENYDTALKQMESGDFVGKIVLTL